MILYPLKVYSGLCKVAAGQVSGSGLERKIFGFKIFLSPFMGMSAGMCDKVSIFEIRRIGSWRPGFSIDCFR